MFVLIASIIMIISAFRIGYRMNWEITREIGIFTYITVKKPFRKFFTLKNSSDKIINVALYLEIMGYIFFIIQVLFNSISFLVGFLNNEYYFSIRFTLLVYFSALVVLYVITIMGFYKFLCWKLNKNKI